MLCPYQEKRLYKYYVKEAGNLKIKKDRMFRPPTGVSDKIVNY
jgi:hypothetical protein